MVNSQGELSPEGSAPRRRRRLGTAGRLALFHTVIVAAVLGIVVSQFVNAFATYYHSTIVRDLGEEVTEFSTAAASRPGTQPFPSFVHDYLESHMLPSGRVLVVSLPSHTLMGSSGSQAVMAVPAAASWLRKPPTHTILTTIAVKHVPQEVLVTPIIQGHQTLGTFMAVASLARLQTERERVLMLSLGEAAITLLAGVTSVYLILRRVLGTVGRVTQTAGEIAEGGDLSRRLGNQGADDEVGKLAATFDAMIGKVETTMSAQRKLLSDVSHQLRTPLTVARGHLEVLNRGGTHDPEEVHETVDVVVEELDHMRSLVERLLFLGHALEPDFLEPEPIDLRSFLFDVVEAGRVLAPRNWTLGPVPDVVVTADPSKLRGALLNLIDNAVNATGPADSVRVEAQWAEHEGELWGILIAIEDSGPGIAPDQREAALVRFARPGATNTRGSGLGLAIVTAVAESHGGHVSISDSPLGGARVAIVLPTSCIGVHAPPPAE